MIFKCSVEVILSDDLLSRNDTRPIFTLFWSFVSEFFRVQPQAKCASTVLASAYCITVDFSNFLTRTTTKSLSDSRLLLNSQLVLSCLLLILAPCLCDSLYLSHHLTQIDFFFFVWCCCYHCFFYCCIWHMCNLLSTFVNFVHCCRTSSLAHFCLRNLKLRHLCWKLSLSIGVNWEC